MRKKSSYGFTLLVVLALILSSLVVTGAPITAHERYGQVLENETDPVNDGYTLTSWIYGVEFGENTTYNGDGSFVIHTDGDDDTDTTCKYGGLNGDPISYRLEDNSGNIYYMNENDTFISGGIDHTDLTYQITSQPDPSIKINELVLTPSDGGNQYVYLHAPSSFNLAYWRLENHDGFTSTLDSLYTQQAYGNLYVNLTSSSLLNSTQDELMLSWDPHGTGINNNNWVVMDRVEYGNQTTQPDNTTLKDYPLESPIPQGQSLKRTNNGSDTNDCEADFSIQDTTPRPAGETENHQPVEPYNPLPQENATGVSLDPTLTVNVSDPDGDSMTVTFYNASDDSQIVQKTGVSNGTTNVSWTGLVYNHTYRWYVESSDWEFTNTSKTWSFNTTTAPEPNHPPDEPFDPYPQNGTTGVSTSPTISVNVTDPDGDDMNVSFYNANTTDLIQEEKNVSDGGNASVTWSGLNTNQTYYWYAEADDGINKTSSSIWHFTTKEGNRAPLSPNNPSPPDGAKDVEGPLELGVDIEDPDGDTMNVTFYDASDNSEIGTNQSLSNGTVSATWTGLSTDTQYRWYTKVSDGTDSTRSDTWSFITSQKNDPPTAPTDPSPKDGAANLNLTPTLTVNVSDPDGDPMNVTFYDASNNNTIGMEEGVTNGSVSTTWSGLAPDTTYSWYVTANDSLGSNTSVTWSFTTFIPGQNDPPTEPHDPKPADGSVVGNTTTELEVNVSDPDGDEMTVTFYNASNDTVIGENTGVTNGTTSSIWKNLTRGTEYTWYVVASDGQSDTKSTNWTFTTLEQTNRPPIEPYNPSPEDGKSGLDRDLMLKVNVSDPDGDEMIVTFYDASNDSVIKQKTGIFNGSISIMWRNLTVGTDYTWYVIVSDGQEEIRSTNWTFTTYAKGNSPPLKPDTPQPDDGEKNVSLDPALSVEVIDPDGDDLNVTFYNASDNSIIGQVTVTSGTRAQLDWTGRSENRTYEWYITADDGEMTTQSPIWNFTTVSEVSRGVEVTGPSKETEKQTGRKTYSFTVENVGETSDTYTIEVETSQKSWNVSSPNRVTVPAGEGSSVEVEVTIPSDTEKGDSSQIELTATSENGTDISDSHTIEIHYEPTSEPSEAPEYPVGITLVAVSVILVFISLAIYRKREKNKE